MNTPSLKRRRWLTAYAPLIFWIFVIFGLGSDLGSMNETSRFIRPLLEFLFPDASPETLSVGHAYIRKLAHITVYAVLAILAKRAFDQVRRPFLSAIAVVAAVAFLDEINQSLDPSRTGTPVDVLIDCVGGVLGLTIWWIMSRMLPKISKT